MEKGILYEPAKNRSQNIIKINLKKIFYTIFWVIEQLTSAIKMRNII